MPRSAYKSKIDVSFVLDNQETKLNSNFIKYIMIENLYESRYMPVIYLSMALPTDIYTSILENEKKGKIYLSIQRYNVYSKSSIYKKYIEGQFTYILSSTDPNYTQDISENSTSDNSYKIITIALISMEIMNLAKSSFNGIFGEIDSNTLLLKALEGLNAVVKQPLYNPYFDTLLVPALNSKSKLINFIFDKCPFYDTNYMFFIDFNRAYLLDLTGEYCDANDGQEKSVYIDVRKVTEKEAFYEGMEVKNGAYYIYMNPADTIVSENKSADKVSNQMVSVHDDGSVDFVDLEINNNKDSAVKQVFRRGDDVKLYKNILESNTVIIEIAKENIDSSVLTPNKEYIVNNYDIYSSYNGKYTLLYKKEVIVNIDGEFGISVCLGLRKVGNIISLGADIAKQASRRNSSAAYRYSNNVNKTKTTTARKTNSGNTIKNNNSTFTLAKVIPMVNRVKATANMSLKRTSEKIINE